MSLQRNGALAAGIEEKRERADLPTPAPPPFSRYFCVDRLNLSVCGVGTILGALVRQVLA